MDYARTYWLLFLGIGLVFAVRGARDWLSTGRVTVWVGVTLVVSAVVVTLSAAAVRYPERSGGPTEPNLSFAAAVFAFVLLLTVTVLQVLGV